MTEAGMRRRALVIYIISALIVLGSGMFMLHHIRSVRLEERPMTTLQQASIHAAELEFAHGHPDEAAHAAPR
jgi:hypothetical protein